MLIQLSFLFVVVSGVAAKFDDSCCALIEKSKSPVDRCFETADVAFLDCVAEKGTCVDEDELAEGLEPEMTAEEKRQAEQFEQCTQKALEEADCILDMTDGEIEAPCGIMTDHPGNLCFDESGECAAANTDSVGECLKESEGTERELNITKAEGKKLLGCLSDMCTESCNCMTAFGGAIMDCMPAEAKAQLTEDDLAEIEEIKQMTDEAGEQCMSMCGPLEAEAAEELGIVSLKVPNGFNRGMRWYKHAFVNKYNHKYMKNAQRKYRVKQAHRNYARKHNGVVANNFAKSRVANPQGSYTNMRQRVKLL
jgi:hypothetical protein